MTDRPNPAAILQSLIGSWAIERRIDDVATLSGRAEVTRTGPDEAVYHERGTLRLSSGHESAAERKYIYRQCEGGLAVFFDERPPRLFHEVALIGDAGGGLHGAAEHVCVDDLYVTDYQFEPDGGFRIRHRVRGPRKDYTMVTFYRRIDGAGR
ncbi:MAG: DUF6314 family protein [Pseudolabrys sp.]